MHCRGSGQQVFCCIAWSQTWQHRSRFLFESFSVSGDSILLTSASHDRRQQEKQKPKTKNPIRFVLLKRNEWTFAVHSCLYFSCISLPSQSEQWEPGLPNGCDSSFLSPGSNWSITLLTGQHKTFPTKGMGTMTILERVFPASIPA